MSTSRAWSRLNDAEARFLDGNPALPDRAPHPAVIAVSTAARGGGLWLALSACEAVRRGGDRRAARHTARCVLVALAVSHAVKRIAPARARPEGPGGRARGALWQQPDSSSFPSSHAATAAAFATAAIIHRGPRGALLLPLPLVAVYSRVRARVHWPTDVAAGAAIGAAAAFATRANALVPDRWRRRGSRGWPQAARRLLAE